MWRSLGVGAARFRSSAGSRILPKHSGVLTQCQGVARGVFKPPLVQAWLASILLPLASPANEAQDRRYSCGSTASRVAERVCRSRRAALGPIRKPVPRKTLLAATEVVEPAARRRETGP